MLNDEELESVNRKLMETFGYEGSFKARYRLKWTTGYTEKRLGTFSKFDIHCNVLGEKHDICEVLKYPYHQNRYVIERIFYFQSEELPTAHIDGSYEAVYYFEDDNGKYTEPSWDACLAICNILERPKTKKTASEIEAERIKEETEQIWKDYLYLEEIGRHKLFYDNAGTFIDSTKVLKEVK